MSMDYNPQKLIISLIYGSMPSEYPTEAVGNRVVVANILNWFFLS